MPRTRSLLLALAVAVPLVWTGLVVPPVSAAPTGTLRIHVVDSSGHPVTGAIYAVGDTDSFSSFEKYAVSDHDFALPPGRYGAVSLTPWGGLTCYAIADCDGSDSVLYGPEELDPATQLTVTDGGLVEATIVVGQPAVVTGSPTVGGLLTVTLTAAMQRLVTVFTQSEFPGTVAYQWLRDGAPIPTATGTVYAPRTEDAGHAIAVRLTLGAGFAYYFGPTGPLGGDNSPRTLAASTIKRIATATYLQIARSPVRVGQRASLRVDVTGTDKVVTGKVVVTVGKRRWTVSLRNGSARLRLPALAQGRYVVRASYGGTSAYQPSTSRRAKLVVKARAAHRGGTP